MGEHMEALITQLVAGAISGNTVGAILKQQATSIMIKTIVGAIGGVGGGLLFNLIGGETGLTSLITNGIGGLLGGGILTAIVGAMTGRK
jgi:hypothetical protein